MRNILLVSIALMPFMAMGQALKPGFDKAEYIELLKVAQRQHIDVNYFDTIKVPAPQHSKLVYRSPAMAFENIWDLWMRDDKVAILSIRGTTAAPVSWLANLYAAMVPAKGKLELEEDFIFKYNLSDDPNAAVHIGWLIATAYLSRDMLPRIDSCYKAGIRDFIITGHSQGAGISFLITSYLANRQAKGKLPADIRFKTYASAAPKPGNLYYAYSYEHLTRNGWGYTVVNSADWVPETPFSIQTLDDFNATNAFTNADAMISSQKFPTNLAMRHMYNKLSKPARKAQQNYEKYLGNMVSKIARKQLPEYQPGEYYQSNNYTRTGSMIILYAKKDYYERFPDGTDNIWMHHFIQPYLYLAQQLDQ